ncbi:MAG TPA: SCP2 sterol-binding domain-containing protein [Micromonosporaceae bacterium]
MAGREAEFFDQIGRLGHTPWLAKIDGSIRFDVTEHQDIRHWLLTIRAGFVAVTREYRPADTVVESDSDTLDRLLAGRLRLLPAWLRNEIAVEGRPMLVLVLERLVPRSPQLDRPLRGVAGRAQ